MQRMRNREGGFTLIELMIVSLLLGTVAISMLALYVTLVHSAVVAKRQAVALTLATNEMEYLKSLPYNSLAVGSPTTTVKKVNGIKYTITMNVSYADDAYDGCGAYPNQTLKQQYCRNYPPPAGAPATDTNPQDYKVADVSVIDPAGLHLADLDTQVAARVAETASNTGALFVTVIDQNGAPITNAAVHVVNGTVTPAVDQTLNTDQNGIAIFYGLPPDNKTDYVITASKTNYSTLFTISKSGVLQPTYPSQAIINQQASYVTLMLKLQGANSLMVETTDTNGNALPGATVYIKGGYKSYTSTSDTTYYYDNQTPTDTRPTTDSNGVATVSNLVPGTYIFCGDDGSSGCAVGGSKYYLAAALPYGSTNPLNPITVPIYDPSNPPSVTFPYNSTSYLQKVRLMLTGSANFPRVFSLTPYEISASSGTIGNFLFTITGQKLSCGSGSGCNSSVKFVQGSNTYTASCTGGSGGTQLDCSVDLTGVAAGNAQLIVGNGSGTLTLPFSPQLGGLNVGS